MWLKYEMQALDGSDMHKQDYKLYPQVGLGTAVGSIDQVPSQGTIQPTNRNTDFLVEGSDYFVVDDGEQNYYSRAGNFDIDAWV